MPKTRRKDNQKPIERDRVAQAVFAAAESMGISDRKLLEKFTEQVSQRLEVAQPFPSYGRTGSSANQTTCVFLSDSGNG